MESLHKILYKALWADEANMALCGSNLTLYCSSNLAWSSSSILWINMFNLLINWSLVEPSSSSRSMILSPRSKQYRSGSMTKGCFNGHDESPDLNVIKNLWHYFKTAVHKWHPTRLNNQVGKSIRNNWAWIAKAKGASSKWWSEGIDSCGSSIFLFIVFLFCFKNPLVFNKNRTGTFWTTKDKQITFKGVYYKALS